MNGIDRPEHLAPEGIEARGDCPGLSFEDRRGMRSTEQRWDGDQGKLTLVGESSGGCPRYP